MKTEELLKKINPAAAAAIDTLKTCGFIAVTHLRITGARDLDTGRKVPRLHRAHKCDLALVLRNADEEVDITERAGQGDPEPAKETIP